jgi:hypothetical protein
MAWINARLAAANDAAGTNVTHVQWSANGSSETGSLARTAVTLGAATSAHPSVIANSGAIESAAASADVTITHFAFAADGTVQTEWTALAASRALTTGDKLSAAAGALKVSLYRSATAP